jgi:DNA-3-methyladenine glycosylase II
VLHPVPPFRLDLTVWALRRRPSNTIDRWNGHTYERALVIDERPVDVLVSAVGTPARPRLEVTVRAERTTSELRAQVASHLERMLGLRLDLRAFYRMARADRHLGPLAERFRGVKPPRFPNVFEAVVNGIACQQLSLSVGLVLLDRLAALCGPRSPSGAHAFPRSRDVMALRSPQVRALGFNHNKVRALLELARAAETSLDLEHLARRDDIDVVEELVALRGIGRWTAEYVLLRGLGRLAVFPGDDVGARANLARWLALRSPLDAARVRRLTGRWQPYAGFLYFHLLLQRLSEQGVLT